MRRRIKKMAERKLLLFKNLGPAKQRVVSYIVDNERRIIENVSFILLDGIITNQELVEELRKIPKATIDKFIRSTEVIESSKTSEGLCFR